MTEILDDNAAAIQQRCAAAAARLRGGGRVDLTVVASDLEQLPPQAPARAVLAATLVTAAVRQPHMNADSLRGLERILLIAEQLPPDWPAWPQIRSLARMFTQAVAGSDRGLFDAHEMVAELDRLTNSVDGQQQSSLLRAMGTTPAFLAAAQDHDHAAMAASANEFRRLRDQHGPESPLGLVFGVMAESAALLMAHEQGDDAERRRGFERVAAAAARLPPQHPMRTAVEEQIRFAGPMLKAMEDGGDSTVPDGYLDTLEAFAEEAHLSAGARRFYRAAAGMIRLNTDPNLDRVGIDVIVDDMRQAVADCPPGSSQRPLAVINLGLALVRRSELLGERADLEEAEPWLIEAREGARGPDDPIRAMAVEGLALVQRGMGRAGGARRLDLEQLRRHAWSVLLQSDVRAATIAAREAAAEAVSAARTCLSDGVPGDAVRALDAGRGLVLFAATELRDVAGRLAVAGHDELGAQWRAATAQPDATTPAPLRRAVIEALSADSGGRLLDPPTIAEIRGALRAQDTDALVYLVTGDGPMPGAAVIVPAYGPPGFMALSNLRVAGNPDVRRYLDAVAAPVMPSSSSLRSARDLPPESADGLDACVDRLCDWMWKAAMGPLLQRYAERELPPVPGRVHRLVLVPMGELAQLPWAAARRGDGIRAVNLVALSQTPSARLLCENAALSPVPPAPTGLVVGDPDTGGVVGPLLAARLEADAVRRAFYPGARYVGRRPDGRPSRSGPGSGDEVRAWLADAAPAAGTVLHLACHGLVNARGVEDGESTSYLLLAGGDRLSAEELVALMARNPHRELGLVVLAGCRTGTSTRGYDEAYSLGTAFLAGGARSVLSTLWSIDDRATSVLMYLFHHNLMVGRFPVREALRQAQLWMLDPHRQPLPSMPPQLNDPPDGAGFAAVSAWAGFVHWGQ